VSIYKIAFSVKIDYLHSVINEVTAEEEEKGFPIQDTSVGQAIKGGNSDDDDDNDSIIKFTVRQVSGKFIF